MSHPDPEDLALGALEGFADGAVLQHLAGCPQCRDEVESLRHVVAAGRAAGRGDEVLHERPSEAVWDRIASDLGLPAEGGTAAPATPLAATRDRRWWQRTTAWVAAAALALGAVATVAIQRLVAADRGAVVASADLEPLPGWDASGTADVRETDGDRVLVVDLATAPDQGFREVWLISLDLQRLVSLGVLTGSEGSFDVPDGLDLDDFAIVDVSAEPLDGDPAHSGDSIVRGELA